MAATVAQLQVSVGADISGALSGLNRINRAVASAGGFFGRAASTAAGFIGGALGLQAVEGVAGNASDAIFGFNASLEQSRTSFGVMLGSGQAASDFLQRLQTFAISTPFEFPQLVSAAQRMLAFGFAAGDVIPLLTDIGNVASASPSGFAEGLDRISLALGQMQAKGRVQGDELLQLQEAGVNTGQVFAIMAQQTGKTVPALQKMQQAGKLLPATFITAFQTFSKQRFGGLMDAQSRTFTGAVSNIKDALHIGLANAFAPLFELVKAGAIVLANFLMTPQFQQWVATVQGAVGKVTTIIGAFASEWAALMTAHGVGFFQAGLIALELLIGRTFGPQAQGAFHGFLTVLGQAPGFLTGTVLPLFMRLAAWVQSTLLPVLGQIGAFLIHNIVPILAFVGAFQGALQVAGIIAGVATALTFLLSPIGLIAGAVGLLAAAWATDFGGIREIVGSVWAALQPLFGNVQRWLPLLGGLAAGFAAFRALTFIVGIITTIGGAIGGLAATFAGAGGGIAGIVAVLGGPVTIAIVAIAAAIGLLAAAWMGNWGNIQGIVFGAWAVIQPILSDLWTWLSTNVPAALTTLAGFWTDTLQPALSAVWDFLSTTLIPLFQALGNVELAILGDRIRGLAAVWNDVLRPALQWISDHINGPLMDAFRSIWSWVSTKLAPVFNALGAAITFGGGKIPDWLTAATQALNSTAATINAAPALAAPLPAATLPAASVPVASLPGPTAAGGGVHQTDNSVNFPNMTVNASDQVEANQFFDLVASAAAQGQAAAANTAPAELVGAS